MTRILLPVLIGIFAILGLIALVPIVIRELVWPYRRTRELDEWAADVPEYE